MNPITEANAALRASLASTERLLVQTRERIERLSREAMEYDANAQGLDAVERVILGMPQVGARS